MLKPNSALQRPPLACLILFPSYFDFQTLPAFDLATVTDTKKGYHTTLVTQQEDIKLSLRMALKCVHQYN